MYPAEKQTMQLQARATCASAVHVISAAGVRKSSVVWRVSNLVSQMLSAEIS